VLLTGLTPFGEARRRRAIELVSELIVAPDALVVDATEDGLLSGFSLEDREFKLVWQGVILYGSRSGD